MFFANFNFLCVPTRLLAPLKLGEELSFQDKQYSLHAGFLSIHNFLSMRGFLWMQSILWTAGRILEAALSPHPGFRSPPTQAPCEGVCVCGGGQLGKGN